MFQKKNISKHLLIVLGLVLFIYLILFYHKPKSLTGEWFAIGSHYSDQNHWSIDDSLNLLISTNIFSKSYFDTLHIVVSDSNTYEFVSDKNYQNEFGFITEYKKDTVRFSEGLELIRISPTKTEYNLLQFQNLLLDSIIELDFNFKVRLNRFEMFDSYEMKARLFPNDSLTTRFSSQWGNAYVADEYGIITNISGDNYVGTKGFTGDYVNLEELWGIYSINGLFIMQYGFHHYIGYSYLIHEISDSSFSGSVYFRNQLLPFSATIRPTISKEEKRSIEKRLISTNWKTKKSSIREPLSSYQADYDKKRRKSIENDRDVLVITSFENDAIDNSITFQFKNDNVFLIQNLGVPTEVMKWKISDDGRLLILYKSDYSQPYHTSLEVLTDPTKELILDLPVFFEQPDSSIIENYMRFELTWN